MNKILNSASKIVLILLAVCACIGLFTNKLEAKDFMLLATMTFTYYFSAYKSNQLPPGGAM